MRDGGRPSEAALQEEASNHSKLRWTKAKVVSVREKVSKRYQVRVKEMKRLNHCRSVESVKKRSKPRGSR